MKHGYENRRRDRAERCGPEGKGYGRKGAFGPKGPFGRHGPYGRDGDFGPDGPYGSGGPFGRGGRRGKRFAGEELRLMVLGLLEEIAPQHGYQLIRRFAEKSGDAYSPSPGVLYPLLTLLADMALVEEVSDEGSARRSYALTDAGRKEVTDNREAIDASFARLAALGDNAGRADSAPVRRAMMNLRAAVMQRMTAAGATDETGFAAAAILDEAAQKIERL